MPPLTGATLLGGRGIAGYAGPIRALRRSAGLLLAAILCAAAAGCGASGDQSPERRPVAAPNVALTANDRRVWAPGPPSRAAVPVLLYHGVAPRRDFSNRVDSQYGIAPRDFATQMALLRHAGYRTITLETFVRFVDGDRVRLPAHPLLLTFDDARADSWTGADAVLRELGWSAVMFVDVGAVDRGDAEYLTWPELSRMERSGRWELQLHAGRGHQQMRYGPGADDVGPFYAYRRHGESIAGWRRRVFSDITWGERQLADHVPGYRPLAFAPPYGNYGRDSTNDPRIPARAARLAGAPLPRDLHPGPQPVRHPRSVPATRPPAGHPQPQRW